MSKALDGGDRAADARIKALDKQLNQLKKEQTVRQATARAVRVQCCRAAEPDNFARRAQLALWVLRGVRRIM